MPPPQPLLGGAAPAPARAAPSFLHLLLHTRHRVPTARAAAASSVPASHSSHANDALLLRRAADVADRSAGLTSPHPNFGCVIARPQPNTDSTDSWVVGEGFLYAQGTPCAELLAAQEAGEHACGSTAYLNLEPGDCFGDNTAVGSLVQAGITRVVVGLRHPLKHLRGKAIQALRSEGIQVDVVGEDLQSKLFEEALKSCLTVNAPLLYRAAFHVPFSVLKYAMTADGKIAASSGHASWISGKASRGRVFELRGRSDAVIVGGNTVRFDDPRLTARHVKGHVPVRIVMSQSLNLPDEANLWNVNDAYTIVATQRGARRDFQKKLAMKGVEVVEFDMLNPRNVMSYCYDRGYLAVLWECGGTLAASAIAASVIHKVYAFWAPKIIGGLNAPTPVGDLGMNQMTQAINLIDVSYEQIDRDMLMSGFIEPIPDLSPVIPSVEEIPSVDPEVSPYEANIISFYKTWDIFGAFSNFSPHPIHMPDENGDYFTWPTVEYYYQAHKFVGVDNPQARDIVQEIKLAKSPEEAARIGRTRQKGFPELVRTDWETTKIDVMYRAIKCKFSTYPHLTNMLLSTAGSILVEASPHDLFWGGGREGEGLNYLGRLLMQLRSEILGTVPASAGVGAAD
ncbi:riboflavin biosynthesis protein PYRR, chloroplastic isoform X1 [Sorghum bicolor]|uniref:riboflavin biosynthesis protein PYRR, chloroplastic isoform X1 n=1 Tax=Sorghum bicolor TaxID=4558 RepID=UPI000B42626D|nr:riboflavin biosynthesis protein PYRR, chloroplastic isoform X1 [Sorghum bicolor]|eukprot:XP_021314969.1 riboflavin biosynthesis protein PYRR, chloroplastic isoform X1 [Sorghum bicolor]